MQFIEAEIRVAQHIGKVQIRRNTKLLASCGYISGHFACGPEIYTVCVFFYRCHAVLGGPLVCCIPLCAMAAIPPFWTSHALAT